MCAVFIGFDAKHATGDASQGRWSMASMHLKRHTTRYTTASPFCDRQEAAAVLCWWLVRHVSPLRVVIVHSHNQHTAPQQHLPRRYSTTAQSKALQQTKRAGIDLSEPKGGTRRAAE